jgi:hypothetical protein
MKLTIIAIMVMMVIPSVLATSIFDTTRPTGYYCESNEQCASHNCANSFCTGSCADGCSRQIALGGSQVITFFQENHQILRNAVIVFGAIIILYVLRLKGVF